ncbi:hypothetical protein DL767_007773 [Monosporascus sp. MG133]|nr:hypothetical protein DL767_007773 [Monosporascus sp. MG133]
MGFADKFELAPDLVPKVKLGIHLVHSVIAFVIFVLEIVLFRAQDSVINGNNGWTFAMCFITIPAVIYLTMAPRWERTRRLANPHAMTVIDCIWAILWLSAFATQVSYNKRGSCGQACSVSKAIAALAFFQTLFWLLSTGVSYYTLRYTNNNGFLPGYENLGNNHQNIDPDKAAFSTSMAPHDEEAYAPVSMEDRHDNFQSSPYNADSYGAGSSSGGMFDTDTAYKPQSHSPPPQDNPFDSGYRVNNLTPLNDAPIYDAYGDPYAGPSSSSYGSQIYAPPAADDYDSTRPVQFPPANYDRTMH